MIGNVSLRELLAIERERLVVAREIERKRQVVFPETSVIVRDIERLLKEIESREGKPQPTRAAESTVGRMRRVGG